jgi:aspartate aminotransferase-like enzyme
MLPAGGAFLAFSQKALKAVETSTYPRCFLDLKDQITNNATGYTPYTPNLPILYGLRKSLDLLFAEGNPSGVKCALAEMGLCENQFRLPVVPVSYATHEKIAAFVRSL